MNRLLRSFFLVGLVVLAACSTAPTNPNTAKAPSERAPVVPQVKKTEPSIKGGGYYLDDGPMDTHPADIALIPQPVPKVEPLVVPTTRPYTVMGQSFVPQTSLSEPYSERGHASWYGKKFHGAKTASGEIYDMFALTAAHPTLPLPSYARVTNLSNGKSIIVRVNDRGPFLRGRIMDLSYAAAYQLDYINHGRAEVLVEKMTPELIAQYVSNPKEAENIKMNPSGEMKDSAFYSVAVAPSVSQSARQTGVYLQIGAFGNRKNAQSLLDQVKNGSDTLGNAGRIHADSGLHRVLLGPFADLDLANEAAMQLSAIVPIKPVVKQNLILP